MEEERAFLHEAETNRAGLEVQISHPTDIPNNYTGGCFPWTWKLRIASCMKQGEECESYVVCETFGLPGVLFEQGMNHGVAKL